VIHRHHRKRRPHCSAIEYDHQLNILPLEDEVHELVHRNPELAYKHGLLIRSWMSLDEAPAPDVDEFLAALGRTPVGNQVAQGSGEPMQTTVDGEEVPHKHVVTAQGVEKPCPKCKGAGKVVEQPKDESQEQAPPRPKTTWSVRVPKDERENGYELLENLMESAVEKMHAAGLIRDVNKGANYYTLILALRKFVLGELD
jgi:hypothetical protein